MTCQYTGCNVPEGECSGACLNKEIVVSEKIESLCRNIDVITWPGKMIPVDAQTTLQLVELLKSAKIELERIATLEAEVERLEGEIEQRDLDEGIWPEWAEKALKLIRKQSGYDGYDDQSEGVDLLGELDEMIDELNSIIRKLQAQLTAANKKLAQGGEVVGYLRRCWGPDCGPYVEFYTAEEMGYLKKDGWLPLYRHTQAQPSIETGQDGLKNACAEFRDVILNQRGLLAENGMNGDQVNDVLNEFDSIIDPHLSTKQAASVPPAVGVPEGWKLERCGEHIHLKRSDGMWCGFGDDMPSPAVQFTYQFMSAMLASAPPVQAVEQDGFYLASFKDGRSNGVMCWWGPDNCGYTPYLEQAGIYKAEDITPGYHDNEYTVPVPVAYARQFAVSQVDTGFSGHNHWWSAEKLRAALSPAPNDSVNGGA